MTKAADQTIRALQDFITDWVGSAAARSSTSPATTPTTACVSRSSSWPNPAPRPSGSATPCSPASSTWNTTATPQRFVHKIASAVFEKPGMAENVIEYWSEADCGGKYIICEILEHRP